MSSPSQFQKIQTNGVALNTLIKGEGKPVLLVHGFPDDHTIWENQVDELVEAGFQVIAPDMRGCGESGITSNLNDYAVESLAADLAGLLDALGIEKVYLAGHDWGASICWMFSILRPERVIKYAALSVGHPLELYSIFKSPPSQKLRSWYMLVFQLTGFTEKLMTVNDWAVFRFAFAMPMYEDEIIKRLSRPGRLTASLNYYRANKHLFVARDMPRVRVPVMGIYSTGDRYLLESQMTKSADYMDAPWRYERIEGASHWLQVEAADRINALLSDYFTAA